MQSWCQIAIVCHCPHLPPLWGETLVESEAPLPHRVALHLAYAAMGAIDLVLVPSAFIAGNAAAHTAGVAALAPPAQGRGASCERRSAAQLGSTISNRSHGMAVQVSV
jgi:hypothetical protein